MMASLLNDEYHKDKAIGSTSIKNAIHGYDSYLWHMSAPVQKSEALEFGSLVHTLTLEPADFYNKYAVKPKIDLRTKEGKEKARHFEENNDRLIIIDADTFNKAKMMADSVWAYPPARDAIYSATEIEMSFFAQDPETKLKIKARPDALRKKGNDVFIYDLKTISPRDTLLSMTCEDLLRHIKKCGYHISLAHYEKVFRLHYMQESGAESFDFRLYIIFLSSKMNLGRHEVRMIEMGKNIIAEGRDLAARGLSVIANEGPKDVIEHLDSPAEEDDTEYLKEFF